MDHDLLIKNAVSTVRAAKAFDVPIVHSTVSVASGQVKRPSTSLPRCWRMTRRSSARRSTRGRTPSSWRRFERQDGRS